MTRHVLDVLSKKRTQAYITYFTYTSSLTVIVISIILSYLTPSTKKEATS